MSTCGLCGKDGESTICSTCAQREIKLIAARMNQTEAGSNAENDTVVGWIDMMVAAYSGRVDATVEEVLESARPSEDDAGEP